MTVKCTFCNDTKQEPGIPGPCVWCEQVGAAPVSDGYQFAKGFTDPVGDCENFEAGIHVNAWFQRIVVYGHSPEDADKLRDYILSYAEREAALREENKLVRHDIASYLETAAKTCELLEIDVEAAKNAEGKPSDVLLAHAQALQQRLAVAEQRAGKMEELLREAYEAGDHNIFGTDLDSRIEAALKPAAEQRATEMKMDKRRLDFLQENLVSINCRVRNTGFCGPRGREFAAYIYAAGPNDKKPGEGETLRQAIDSMMENNGDALKPAEEPHKCIECESQYCHGVCVERGDDDERYKGAEGEGS